MTVQYFTSALISLALFIPQYSHAASWSMTEDDSYLLVLMLKDSGVPLTHTPRNNNESYVTQAVACTSTTGTGPDDGRICFLQTESGNILQANDSSALYSLLAKNPGVENCPHTGSVAACTIRLKSISCLGLAAVQVVSDRYSCDLSSQD